MKALLGQPAEIQRESRSDLVLQRSHVPSPIDGMLDYIAFFKGNEAVPTLIGTFPCNWVAAEVLRLANSHVLAFGIAGCCWRISPHACPLAVFEPPIRTDAEESGVLHSTVLRTSESLKRLCACSKRACLAEMSLQLGPDYP